MGSLVENSLSDLVILNKQLLNFLILFLKEYCETIAYQQDFSVFARDVKILFHFLLKHRILNVQCLIFFYKSEDN
jgi:hypothetical protein